MKQILLLFPQRNKVIRLDTIREKDVVVDMVTVEGVVVMIIKDFITMVPLRKAIPIMGSCKIYRKLLVIMSLNAQRKLHVIDVACWVMVVYLSYGKTPC